MERQGAYLSNRPWIDAVVRAHDHPLFRSSTNAAQWHALGPWHAPNGIGRINCVAFHPTDTSIIFAGAPSGGFWKTTDGGQHWITTTDHFASIGVSDIAVNPANPDIIYIATGDKDLWDSKSIGILKSIDGGMTWDTTGLIFTGSESELVVRVLIDPRNTRTLYAATTKGIFKSIDAGATWTHPLATSMRDLEMHPTNGMILYAGSANGQFFRSTDAGETWTDRTASLGFPDTSKHEWLSVAVTPARPGLVYVMEEGEPPNNISAGIYRSNDSGTTFEKMADNATKTVVGWYGYSLAVSPLDADEVYCGGGYVFRSSDAGKTWIQPHQAGGNKGDGTFLHVDIHEIRYRGGDVFVGCDGGLFRSAYDPGHPNYWQYVVGDMAISEAYGFDGAATDSAFFVGGFQDIGVGWITGGNFMQSSGGDGMECLVDFTDKKIFYISIQTGRIDRTEDGGKTFAHFIGPEVTGTGGAWTTPFILDPRNPSTSYAGYEDIWKTNDAGAHWRKISDVTERTTIKRVAVSWADTNTIYMLKEWGFGMFRTTDGGAHWDQLKYPSIDNIAIHQHDPRTIWGTGDGVFKSTDGGTTWTDITGSLPKKIKVNAIVYQNDSPERVFVGTAMGVYYRDSSMADWALFGEGLPNADVKKLEIHAKANQLRACTYGRGLWECSLDQFGTPPLSVYPERDGHPASLLAYPNPSAGHLSLQFEPMQGERYMVDLLDALGRTMRTIELPAPALASGHAEMDLAGLPAGAYVVTLRAASGGMRMTRVVLWK
ncbi:MAG TPA: hypothetical protein VHI13_18815 [Candidatus Kapabacteria bacterium]|nr:hypothetical protein [Candidatus Kapabacteria bacterium]